VDRCALVLAHPETGRLHQVRRHLRHINHPLVGDVKHGSGAINRHYRAEYGLHRLALHAHRLAFRHPVTRAPVDLTAPVPDDLAAPLAKLGLSWKNAE
jgi:tRNA pseudouridine65 synthase